MLEQIDDWSRDGINLQNQIKTTTGTNVRLKMQKTISRQSYVFPAIQDEMYNWMCEEMYCDAYIKGYNKMADGSSQGKKCHQVVLAMASPVLKQALEKATDGTKQMCCCRERNSFSQGCFVFDGCIVLADAPKEIVNALINFIYGKEIPESKVLKDEITSWLNVLKVSDTRLRDQISATEWGGAFNCVLN